MRGGGRRRARLRAGDIRPRQRSTPPRIRIATWNIHKEDDAGWQDDLTRFAADHDILLLQEVTLIDALRDILHAAGMRWVMASSFLYYDTDIGVLSATRAVPVAHCTLRVVEPLIRLPKSSVVTWLPLKGSAKTLAVANVHSINFSLSARRVRGAARRHRRTRWPITTAPSSSPATSTRGPTPAWLQCTTWRRGCASRRFPSSPDARGFSAGRSTTSWCAACRGGGRNDRREIVRSQSGRPPCCGCRRNARNVDNSATIRVPAKRDSSDDSASSPDSRAHSWACSRLALCASLSQSQPAPKAAPPAAAARRRPASDMKRLASEIWIYAFPLVLTDVTREVQSGGARRTRSSIAGRCPTRRPPTCQSQRRLPRTRMPGSTCPRAR